MALLFADQLEDISDDDAALRELLATSPDDDLDVNQDNFLTDPDPGFDKPSVSERVIGKKRATSSGTTRKPTAAMRKDIRGKVAMVLVLVGGVWHTRDEYCGSTFTDSIPEVSEAITDILCDSPDIVNWFTSSGKYMKWLTLAAALQPVGAAIFGHHIMHSVAQQKSPADQESPAEQDWSAYSATG